MRKLKVVVFIGTRPEAIKLAPVVVELHRRRDRFATVICTTGQHRELLAQVLPLFGIVPDHNLDLMRENQSLAALTAGVITGVDGVLQRENPDWAIVQGDTTTVMGAALAAFYRSCKVAHVEAGLRTGLKRDPFPEEINRCITDLLADLYLAPTDCARDNLRREGVADSKIRVTGNTAIDALLLVRDQPLRNSPLQERLADGRRLVLVTAHRRENLGEGLHGICTAVSRLADAFRDSVQFVFPVHPNPNVGAMVRRELADRENVLLVEPLDYATCVNLMARSTLILTDSGGIQEEAPSLHVPVLVMRRTTERPEGVEAGVAKLVGTDPEAITAAATRLLTDPAERERMAARPSPYGDGKAAARIVDAILDS